MDVEESEFDALEKHILELATEIESLDVQESNWRERISGEVSRADAAQAEEETMRHAASEARAEAAAAAACANHIARALATTRSDLVAVELQLGPAKSDCAILEKRCSELSLRVSTMEQEIQHLKLLQTEQEGLQQTYTVLEEQVNRIVSEIQKERVNLQNELHGVQRSASSGAVLRERARLAAATHAHQRRLTDAERKQTVEQLRKAKIEIGHLKVALTEAQPHISDPNKQAIIGKSLIEESETVTELRTLLEAERMGATQLKRALDNAHHVNEILKAQLAAVDFFEHVPTSPSTTATNSAN